MDARAAAFVHVNLSARAPLPSASLALVIGLGHFDLRITCRLGTGTDAKRSGQLARYSRKGLRLSHCAPDMRPLNDPKSLRPCHFLLKSQPR